MLNKIFCGLWIFVFLTNQTYALTETEKTAVQVAKVGMAAQDPEALLALSSEIENVIDQNQTLIQESDQTSTEAKVRNQIERHFSRMQKRVSKMKESSIQKAIARANASFGATVNEDQTKEAVIQSIGAEKTQFVTALTASVMKAGGQFAYLLKMKKQLKTEQSNLSKLIKKGEASRSIASTKNVLLGILACILLVLGSLGIVYGIGLIIVPLFIAGMVAFTAGCITASFMETDVAGGDPGR